MSPTHKKNVHVSRALVVAALCSAPWISQAQNVPQEPSPEQAPVQAPTQPPATLLPEEKQEEPNPSASSTGPVLDLPKEMATPPPKEDFKVALRIKEGELTDADLMRGLMNYRFRSAQTMVGGYAQFQLTMRKPVGQPANTRANVRRVIMFLSHNFNEEFRAYTEFEWENAIACSTCVGAVEVEQSFLDWRIAKDDFGLRAGLILVPMGIINQWHEPPVFHGVDRPQFDQFLIPTTWRELGIGAFGQPREDLRYEIYLMTGLNPLKINAAGFALARTGGSLSNAASPAITGRLEWEPALGVIAGLAFFANNAGANASENGNPAPIVDGDGNPQSLFFPVIGWAADARVRRKGLEARIVLSQFFMPNAAKLMALVPSTATAGPVPTLMQGGYIEGAYDILRLLSHSNHQFLPFIRFETYRLQASVPPGYQPNKALNVFEITTGLTYRPIPQIAFKTDIQLRNVQQGRDEFLWNAGLGYMF